MTATAVSLIVSVDAESTKTDVPSANNESKPDKPEPDSSADSDPDSKLFGSLLPLGDSVKLDPVVERKLLMSAIV